MQRLVMAVIVALALGSAVVAAAAGVRRIATGHRRAIEDDGGEYMKTVAYVLLVVLIFYVALSGYV